MPRLAALAFVVLAAFASGCDEGSSRPAIECGEGSLLAVDGVSLGCVYDTAGAACPEALPEAYDLQQRTLCAAEPVSGLAPRSCERVDGACPVGCDERQCPPLVASVCLATEPDALSFMGVETGKDGFRDLTLSNCGGAPLAVTRAVIEGEDADVFFVVGPPLGTLDVRADIDFGVQFSPERLGDHSATLQVELESGETAAVPIVGRGVEPGSERCARPVATAVSLDDPDAEPATRIEVAALDTIRLDGSESMPGFAAEIAEYQWSVLEAPSFVGIPFQRDAVSPVLQVPLVGRYVFELDLVGADGREACAPARVEVSARSNKALVVELTWYTPSDPDETDACPGCGTDLDLHLLSGASNASWGDRGGTDSTDCHVAAPRPNWGDPDDATDDPVLNRDDTDGGGPEQIDIQSPLLTDGSATLGFANPYGVGVYYFGDNGFAGPVFAEVRVFFDGEETPAAVWFTRFDTAGVAGEGGEYWHAGDIEWTADGGQAIEVDEMYLGYPMTP